jgi:hypothetical protein
MLGACGDDGSSSGDGSDTEEGSSSTTDGAATTSGSASSDESSVDDGSSTCGSDCGPCDEVDACTPGASEDIPCPWGRAVMRVCDEACEWSEPPECSKPTGWRDMADGSSAGVAARSEHFAVWTGDAMLVFGGVDGSAAPASYDPDADTWTTIAEPPIRFSPVWTGTELVVIGGDGMGARLDPSVGDWVAITEPHALQARQSFAFQVWMPSTGEVLVWGGYVNGTPFTFADGAAYDVASGSWRTVAASPLGVRDAYGDSGVVWNGTRVIVHGGGSYHGDRYHDAAAYDPVTDEWEMLPQCPASGYQTFSALSTGSDGELAVFWGGNLFEGVAYNYPAKDGAIWDDAVASWIAIPAMPWGGTYDAHNQGASWTDGRTVTLWGGDTFDEHGLAYMGNGSVYDVERSTWTELPLGGPSPRRGVVAVWTGSEAIVWGGFDGTDHADGKIFRPE